MNKITDTTHPLASIVTVLAIASTVDWFASLIFGGVL